MSTDQTPAVTDAEMDAQTGEEIPERDQMSLIDVNAAVPVNAGVAANVLSSGSEAVAPADQSGVIAQQ